LTVCIAFFVTFIRLLIKTKKVGRQAALGKLGKKGEMGKHSFDI